MLKFRSSLEEQTSELSNIGAGDASKILEFRSFQEEQTSELSKIGPGDVLDALGTLLGHSWALLGHSWALLGRSWDAPGSIWEPPGLDFRLSWESPELLHEDSEQPKRTNANIPKVGRKLSKNGPRRFRKLNPTALDS